MNIATSSTADPTPSRARANLTHLAERKSLAAVLQLAALHNWHEGVANHFSLAVNPEGSQFLMNPRWKHFSRIKASDLLLLDVNDAQTMARPDAPDPSAWAIHGRIHALQPKARCILHVHAEYVTALASLADPELKPLDQNAARFFNRVAIDSAFSGVADSQEEGERLAGVLGDKQVLMMGNHGALIVAQSVAEAYDLLYYFERACRTLMLAYASNQPLRILPDDIAEHTAQQWQDYSAMSFAHFNEMTAILEQNGSNYAA